MVVAVAVVIVTVVVVVVAVIEVVAVAVVPPSCFSLPREPLRYLCRAVQSQPRLCLSLVCAFAPQEAEEEEEEEAAVAREHERMVATLRERTAHAPPATQCVICFEQVEEHARRALPCAPERRHWLCAACLRADVAFRRSVRQQCAISRDGPGCRGGNELLCPFCRAAIPEAAAEALLLE